MTSEHVIADYHNRDNHCTTKPDSVRHSVLLWAVLVTGIINATS
jgi:hypothetical protein